MVVAAVTVTAAMAMALTARVRISLGGGDFRNSLLAGCLDAFGTRLLRCGRCSNSAAYVLRCNQVLVFGGLVLRILLINRPIGHRYDGASCDDLPVAILLTNARVNCFRHSVDNAFAGCWLSASCLVQLCLLGLVSVDSF